MKVKEESEKAGLKLSIQKTKIMASSPITSWQIDGETMETVTDYFLGLQNLCGLWLQLWNWKMLAPWKKSNDKPSQCIKKQRHYFADKALTKLWFSCSLTTGCESWTIESWVLKNGCFQTVVLEKILESPLDSKEIQPTDFLNIHWKDG